MKKADIVIGESYVYRKYGKAGQGEQFRADELTQSYGYGYSGRKFWHVTGVIIKPGGEKLDPVSVPLRNLHGLWHVYAAEHADKLAKSAQMAEQAKRAKAAWDANPSLKEALAYLSPDGGVSMWSLDNLVSGGSVRFYLTRAVVDKLATDLAELHALRAGMTRS